MHSYFSEIQSQLELVIKHEDQNMGKVAAVIAEKLRKGGILQLFGCGHSHLLAQEAFYRAGGLVPVNPITIEPLMLHAGALTSSKNEKDATIIQQHVNAFDFQPDDVLIVISTSGRNNAPIDVALLAKRAGITVVSLQSLMYREQETKHSSGKRLEDVVDFVLDTHIPVGDALLTQQDMQYGPASTVIGSAILNGVLCQVIEKMADSTSELPIFKSANVSNDPEHNNKMIDKYQSRIDFK
ncbi:MAG: SIS domain-containing protein [Lysinibacillus sp.]